MPILCVAALCLLQPSFSAEAPFRISDSGLCVRLGLNGAKRWFVIDSGAEGGTIDPAAVSGIPGAQKVANDVAPAAGQFFVKVPTLEIGGARLKNVYFGAGKWGGIGELVAGTKERIAGVLGFNALRMISLGIDFRQCRLWAWPEGHEADKRQTLFGSTAPKLLCRVRVNAHSLPVADCDFAGLRQETLVDLGTYTAFLPADTLKSLKSHVAIGPTWEIGRPTGNILHPAGFVDEVRFGGIRCDSVLAYFGTKDDDVPAGLGWLFFAPLGRVLFDFDQGVVYCRDPGRPLGILDALKSLYPLSFDSRQVVIAGKTRISLAEVRSFMGIRFPRPADYSNPELWIADRRIAAALSSILDGTPQTIVYREKGRRKEIAVNPIQASKRAVPGATPEAVGFETPGYYLVWNRHTNPVPPGEIWIPKNGAQVVAAGGLPLLPVAVAQGDYLRIKVPAIGEMIDELWSKLGWPTPKSPMSFRPDGEATPLSPDAAEIDLPPSLAFSPGSMSVEIGPDGRVVLRQSK
ncbi:MAG TPA: retropepsin-like aspartic protease [Fimbriimonadaceae bacterium]|nr:retropepsin-like aspartic protease [Fimbriimonadaceae bacterium]